MHKEILKTVPARDYGHTTVVNFQDGNGPFPAMSVPGREFLDRRITPLNTIDYRDVSDEPDRMYMLPEDIRRHDVTYAWLPQTFIGVKSQRGMYHEPVSNYNGDMTDILAERFI